MIENPNKLMPAAEYPDEIATTGGPKVRILKGMRFDDPDKRFEELIKVVEAKLVNVDAKIYEGTDSNGRPVLRHYRSLREMMASPTVRKRVRAAFNDRQLKELAERAVEIKDLPATLTTLREGYDFSLGLYEDELAYANNSLPNVFRVTDTVLPSVISPYSKQMLFVDYLDMHRKCWEAAVRNPIAKRIAKIIPQFVLGRGVKGSIGEDQYQEAWDDFWKRNHMRLRLKLLLKELLIYGEVFLRYFETKNGLVVRSIDPVTIWDVVTNPDDLEEVKYYHQQYVLLNNAPAVTVNQFTPSTLIIRHIPAAEIDHFKINSTSSEKRGRSELYAILGWLQRFKEFANDRVLLNKMRAMFALDVSVDGGAAELDAAEEQFATPPGPGAVLIHNKAITTEFKNANNNANEAKTDGDLILKIIAVGAGISEQFLGVSDAQTRAGALIQTEPDVKNFEDHREIVEEMLVAATERVWKAKRLDPNKRMEFTWPSLAQEDRSTKLKDLALSEAMDWFTKERTATMAAREFEVTTYQFNKEQDAIKKERGTEPVIAQGFQQQPKVAPAAPGGDMPGLGGDLAAGAEGGPKLAKPGDTSEKPDVTQTSGQMGFKGDEGGRGLANTQATLNRAAFSRGSEMAAVKGAKSSGTPLRHSAGGEPGSGKGWGQLARMRSLLIRLRKKQERLEEALKGEASDRQRQQVATLRERIAHLEGEATRLREGPGPVARSVEPLPVVVEMNSRPAPGETQIVRDATGRIASIIQVSSRPGIPVIKKEVIRDTTGRITAIVETEVPEQPTA